jgi:nucleotide-binding universal stress UspA family protein
VGVILLLHSGREDSQDAEEYAFELALEEGKKLVCLHVVDPVGYYGVVKHYGEKKGIAERLRKELARKAEERGVEFEFVLREGKVVQTVRDYIQSNEGAIDAIVLGSTRKRIHQKFFFGSVSEQILKLTKDKYHPTIILKRVR